MTSGPSASLARFGRKASRRDQRSEPARSLWIMRRFAASLLPCGLLMLLGCESGHDLAQPTVSRQIAPLGTTADSIPPNRAPKWMDAYCHKAADDLGYAVLCPRRLPRVLDIIPCRGPAPAEELWGKYCFDYVLDSLFSGPPGTTARLPRTGAQVTWRFGRSGQRATSIPMGSSPAPAGGDARAPRSSQGIPATGGPVPKPQRRTSTADTSPSNGVWAMSSLGQAFTASRRKTGS